MYKEPKEVKSTIRKYMRLYILLMILTLVATKYVPIKYFLPAPMLLVVISAVILLYTIFYNIKKVPTTLIVIAYSYVIAQPFAFDDPLFKLSYEPFLLTFLIVAVVLLVDPLRLLILKQEFNYNYGGTSLSIASIFLLISEITTSMLQLYGYSIIAIVVAMYFTVITFVEYASETFFDKEPHRYSKDLSMNGARLVLLTVAIFTYSMILVNTIKIMMGG